MTRIFTLLICIAVATPAGAYQKCQRPTDSGLAEDSGGTAGAGVNLVEIFAKHLQASLSTPGVGSSVANRAYHRAVSRLLAKLRHSPLVQQTPGLGGSEITDDDLLKASAFMLQGLDRQEIRKLMREIKAAPVLGTDLEDLRHGVLARTVGDRCRLAESLESRSLPVKRARQLFNGSPPGCPELAKNADHSERLFFVRAYATRPNLDSDIVTAAYTDISGRTHLYFADGTYGRILRATGPENFPGMDAGYPVPMPGKHRRISVTWYAANRNIDAAMTFATDGLGYMFAGGQYARFSARTVHSGYPTAMPGGWQRMPAGWEHIDAALLDPDDPEVTHWLRDDDVLTLHGATARHGPRRLTELWAGLPPEFQAGIDAATARDGYIFLFKGAGYLRIRDGRVQSGYPRLADGIWYRHNPHFAPKTRLGDVNTCVILEE